MRSQGIDAAGPSHTRVLVLDSGEEAFSSLQKFARNVGITAASLTAIAAFERATGGWFDFSKKTYKEIEVDEQCEVLSAIGDIAIGDDGKPSLQVHIVLGLSNGLTRGVEASARALVPGVLVNVSWNLVSFCWELLRVRTVSS